jgi:hypothetical protein
MGEHNVVLMSPWVASEHASTCGVATQIIRVTSASPVRRRDVTTSH